ncbi:MAG: tRNA pseudouridine(55) synthase TruB [Bacteroidales bacterium]|jgi:tRNA pseudouridine55 synthase|nr:tRNA pseudouridine(55) synthase TruB [Bacteroidales bacterium]MDD4001974.1 tRNA pseudouridine(55) synthase TruB [Bacteroidales bacterium]MDD4529220.1 tRNA pseudouridine(55) synthase TruB [Bacteroidales bacterium]MDD4830244.1 tRNA pseudouridine(55) synthase TruB [Bacteroidales bacterium]
MIDIENGSAILIDKPYTWTSFQVVKKIKYKISHHYGKKIKIGHAGTLDPLATGLLIICVGKYTKRIEEYQSQEKEYSGSFTLGATTPSFDLEHPIDQSYPTEHITEENIIAAAKQFIGKQDQIPPLFSAKWVDGKRAYKLARENSQEIVLKPKEIEIKEFEISSIEFPIVNFRIVCSKGTYIRSIARDFGACLNSGAYLSSLCRTRIGEFCLKDAAKIEEIENLFQ